MEHRSGYFYIVTNLGREGVEGERDGEGGEVNDYCVKRAAVSSPSVWEVFFFFFFKYLSHFFPPFLSTHKKLSLPPFLASDRMSPFQTKRYWTPSKI